MLPTQELEGFGISTIEALACGTPAVGTPAGATPEILSALDRRLLSASPSPADLAATITEVCRAPGLLAAVAARARAHIVPRMSWPAVAAAHLKVYERVAAGR
ncbi:MAG: glycosyltransferase [Solirubrobacteraceae bacterium]